MEIGAGGGKAREETPDCASRASFHDREGYQERSARFNAAATVSSRSTPRSNRCRCITEVVPLIGPRAFFYYAACDLRDASSRLWDGNFPKSDVPRAMVSRAFCCFLQPPAPACSRSRSAACNRFCGCLTFKARCAKSIELRERVRCHAHR